MSDSPVHPVAPHTPACLWDISRIQEGHETEPLSACFPLHPSCGGSCSMKQLRRHKWLFIATCSLLFSLAQWKLRQRRGEQNRLLQKVSANVPSQRCATFHLQQQQQQQQILHEGFRFISTGSSVSPWCRVPVTRSQQISALLLMLAVECALPHDATACFSLQMQRCCSDP